MSTAVGRKLRFGVLVSHPIQYFAPLFRELARRPDIDLTVIYRTRLGVDAYHDPGFGQTVRWDVPLLDGYQHEFLSRKTTLSGVEPKIVGIVLRERFDVLVVHGYNSVTNLLAMAAAKLAGTKLLLRGDTRLAPHHKAAPALKRRLKKWLISRFDGFVAIGSQNRAYYLELGAAEDRIFFAPFSVNNADFALAPEVVAAKRTEIRRSLGIPDEAVVVLYASKLTALKRPSDLITAFGDLARECSSAWLLVAGSGAEMPHLRASVSERGIERIRFIGFQNQQALPGLYAACDLFVLPSQGDAWGLVVNEVMAAGLPVIVSDEVGAAPDLVEGQGTGVVYPCGDIDALRLALLAFVTSANRRLEAGEKSRLLIGHWDVDICAAALVDAALAIVSMGRTKIRQELAGKEAGPNGQSS